MIRIALALTIVLATVTGGEDLLPRVAEGTVELHGTFAGERFWARLNPPDPAFDGSRKLELLYTPPAPSVLGGAHLHDAPFLLFDDRLRLLAWNGRDSLSRATHAHGAYAVTREIEIPTPDGKDVAPGSEERSVRGPIGWDERLAPVLLALCWREGSRGELPAYDLFGRAPMATAVSWRDAQVVIGGRPHRAVPGPSGRLGRLEDAAGRPLLAVAAWIRP